jgi:protocatechuate 3,4-dioxygenase beta subunit
VNVHRSLFAGLGLIALTAASTLAQDVFDPFGNGVQTASQPGRAAAPATRLIPVGTGSISGIVVASDSGRPVRNARVALSGTAGTPRDDADPRINSRPQTSSTQPSETLAVARTVVTNAQGRFTFDRLAAGRYSVSVSRDSYLAGGWGQKRPGGQAGSMLLEDGQRLTLSIALTRGGVITGQVVDEDGDPVRGIQIQVWRSMISNGIRQFRQVASASTDDRGMYRAFGLEPGDYRVSAIPRVTDLASLERAAAETALIESAVASGQVKPGIAVGAPAYVTAPVLTNGPVPNFIPVYAPSTVVAEEAATIHVDPNSEHGPFSINLQYVRTVNVHGVVSLPPGNLSVRVSLIAIESGSTMVAVGSQTGEFTLRNIAPGRYRLTAQASPTQPPRPVNAGSDVTVRDGLVLVAAPNTAGPLLWDSEDITVEGQDVEVGLTLRPTRSISGVVISDGNSGAPPRQVQLSQAPGSNPSVGANVPPVQIDADGRFTLNGVGPGKYVLRASPGTMKSSVLGGEDTLDVPFEFAGDRDVTDAVVTMMDPSKRTLLSGVVTTAAGKPVGDVTVLVAPTDERFWVPNGRRIVALRTDPRGRYQTLNLPPGSYYVATVGELESGGQYEIEQLRAVAARGSRVTLTESGTTHQDFHAR